MLEAIFGTQACTSKKSHEVVRYRSLVDELQEHSRRTVRLRSAHSEQLAMRDECKRHEFCSLSNFNLFHGSFL